MSTTLIFGASGQLGQCLAHVARERGTAGLVFLPEEQANILNPEGLAALFAQHQPAYVINCAAYTAVDKAEDDVELARRINRDGVANLARLCGAHGSTLIQISTDFVFAGTSHEPLLERGHVVQQFGLPQLLSCFR